MLFKRSHSFTCTPSIHLLTEWTIPAFALPAEAGTHLPTPEGWKAELAWCWIVNIYCSVKECYIFLITYLRAKYQYRYRYRIEIGKVISNHHYWLLEWPHAHRFWLSAAAAAQHNSNSRRVMLALSVLRKISLHYHHHHHYHYLFSHI